MIKKIIVAFLLVVSFQFSFAQIGNMLNGAVGGGKTGSSTNTSDTSGKTSGLGFEHRDDAKDSINISFKYLGSIKSNRFDSSINDFSKYYPIPYYMQYLGNPGTAAYSLIYTPYMKAGWDAGFHAFDIYKYSLDDTRFFKTTKPFTQLSYELASAKEQVIKVLHTQNPSKYLNVGFEYRLISAPGTFVTQNTIHNNYRIFSNYQSKRKRYNAYFTLFGNIIKSSENGGITNDSFLLSPYFTKRFSVPTNLGRDSGVIPNPFSSSVNTGNIYQDFTFFLRQSYDIGKKDSIIINDSTTEYLFYSKLRFQHTLTYNSYSYLYQDLGTIPAVYQNWYNYSLPNLIDSLSSNDKWKVIGNDFSLVQFPDTKNLAQFFLAGAKIENIRGSFTNRIDNVRNTTSNENYNVILHGEYINKTRNRHWDISAKGEFYLNGMNAGDYNAYANLARFFNKKWGNVALTFNNVNRSPSYIYNRESSFNLGNSSNYKKENITQLKASADNSLFSFSVTNYLINSLMYFKNYYQADQYNKLINLLQISVSKKIKLARRWNWYTDIVLQQTDGAAPVKVPLAFTRNRIALEGIYYKNLNLSTGVEIKYNTPFKAYNYSPWMGQFMPQDSTNIKNLPEIDAYLHFRIKSFTAFIRAENLNSFDVANGFTFTNNNMAAPHYPYAGFIFRFGIQWNFVN